MKTPGRAHWVEELSLFLQRSWHYETANIDSYYFNIPQIYAKYIFWTMFLGKK